MHHMAQAARPRRNLFETWMNRLARTDQIERLQALSDADLARKGLRREDIVRHVFRDRTAF
ncbi:DUF1127 domain-containing protein [Histidinibacterium lentulum]|uniref:DUF1127 domain-containing protein n=2 Tax=Histidinibacterium lentulum TaxID=2480588 RepID=A0A3N2QVC2_9RHOB|nr:DUF1127 domain-containing protein [Histidinibacterium lentulum]